MTTSRAIGIGALLSVLPAQTTASTEDTRRQVHDRVWAQIEAFKQVAPADPALASELKSLREPDQRHREEGMRLWSEKGTDSPEAIALWAKQDSLDRINQARLEAIVAGDNGTAPR